MSRTSYIPMRRWWCTFCTRLTRLSVFYRSSSQKQSPMGRYVASLWHIIPSPRQLVFTLTDKCCALSGAGGIPIFIVISFTRPSSISRSTLGEHANHYITDVLHINLHKKHTKLLNTWTIKIHIIRRNTKATQTILKTGT